MSSDNFETLKSPSEMKTEHEVKLTPSNIEGQTAPLARTTTQRGLKPRHAQMLALGGTIGTGLFIGSGQALHMGGPVFLVLAYCTLTFLVFGIITATTEMSSYLPVPGSSMTYYATRFFSPSLGFALGWMYWYIFSITVPAEVTAASLVIEYWNPPVPVAVWITIAIIIIVVINVFPVQVYGEGEFWFASLKVLGIIGLLIMAVVLIFGGGPNHELLGFHYWKHPGPVKEYLVGGGTGRLCAFIATTCFSMFAFGFAPELLVVTGGEMQNPSQNLPKAGKRYFYRLVGFYVLGAFAISMITPSDSSDLLGGGAGATASPWAVAARAAGIHALDSVINSIILTSALSAGTSYLYMSSRILYSMAVSDNAPKVFARCTKAGLPYYALIASSVFSLLAYLNVSSSGGTVFNWFVNLINTGGFTSWICICFIYLRFRGATFAQGMVDSDLPYRSIFQPYMAYVSGIIFTLLLFLSGFANFFHGHWDISSFFTAYIGIPIFLVLYFGHRFTTGRKDPGVRPLMEVDLSSGLDEVLASERPMAVRDVKWYQAWKYLYE